MVGRMLKRLAEEKGMQVEGGMAYGLLKGCLVSMSEGAGYKRMGLYIGKKQETRRAEQGELSLEVNPARQAADFIQDKAADFKRYRIMGKGHRLPGVEAFPERGVVVVNFFDNPGTMKCIENFIEEVLPAIATVSRVDVCAGCGEECSDSPTLLQLSEGAVAPMHQACARAYLSDQEDARYDPEKKTHIFLGVVGAILGALLGAALWAVVGAFGYMASFVGAAIAFFSAKGYDLMGGRPGWVKAITLVFCIILAVCLGNAASIVWEIHQIFLEETAAYGTLPITEGEYILEVFRVLIQDSEFVASVSKDLGVGLLFGFLGGYGMVAASKAYDKGRARALEGKISQ